MNRYTDLSQISYEPNYNDYWMYRKLLMVNQANSYRGGILLNNWLHITKYMTEQRINISLQKCF